jgi:O-acetyl-ADP-ribose deacetylase (regulator of RNase III)
VVRGELGESRASAVVRPVRSDGEAITAVGRRLELLAGAAVAERLQALGDLPVGGAVITPAGALAAEFIVHAVLQSAEEPVSALSVQRALVNVVRRARDLGLASVAFPPVGTGAGNLDAEVAARILVEVLRDHLREGADPRSFEIRVESPYEEELFLRLVAATETVGDVP